VEFSPNGGFLDWTFNVRRSALNVRGSAALSLCVSLQFALVLVIVLESVSYQANHLRSPKSRRSMHQIRLIGKTEIDNQNESDNDFEQVASPSVAER
jgi:hypothetical protein